ncbi:PilZ domain-containing protein [Hyalangium versicolor]|uniref:PilZ domain-containing protein n=1 Tax=Hyalangium versicolor TaxID=2861190 RepID=UPI001CC94760|nr:PilZ domain-containing protein [Hyalangium versicolor]
MSFDNERRRHRRYPLRLAIKLHRGDEVLDADIINASASGCLLLSATPLEAGQTLEASIPELLIPRTRLHILRCQSTPSGYMVAAYFDAAMGDEAAIAWLSDEQHLANGTPRWLN